MRLLTVRDRSRREMELRLLRAGYEREAVDRTVERLVQAGLLDDERFAAALAAHERRKGSSSRAVRSRLLAAGVGREVSDLLASDAGEDEEARALDLATHRAATLGRLPPEVAYRRLVGYLQRRGYGASIAHGAAARALEAR